MLFKEAGKFLLRKRTGYLVDKLAVFKKEQSGDTPDFILGCSRLVVAGVDLGNDDAAIKIAGHAVYNR